MLLSGMIIFVTQWASDKKQKMFTHCEHIGSPCCTSFIIYVFLCFVFVSLWFGFFPIVPWFSGSFILLTFILYIVKSCPCYICNLHFFQKYIKLCMRDYYNATQYEMDLVCLFYVITQYPRRNWKKLSTHLFNTVYIYELPEFLLL